MALLGDKPVFGEDLEELLVKSTIVITYHFICFFPVQATTLTFEGVRINPYATFMGPSPFRDVGSWTTTCIFNRADVENEILKYREWLTYILCLADGGPKWPYSKSQLVSRAF